MSKILVRVDGSCIPNPGRMAIGVVIYKDGELIKKVSQLIGNGTNNIAEYRAVIRGLEEIKNIPAEAVEFYCDSQLVVKQLNKQYKVKHKEMISLYSKVQKLLAEIKKPVFFIWNRREENQIADNLARKLLIQEEQNKRATASRNLTVYKQGNIFLVMSKKSKKIYNVNLDIPECDCYDFQNHCRKWNLECKHILAARKFQDDCKMQDKRGGKKMIVLILSKMVSQKQWKGMLAKFNKDDQLPIDIIFPNKTKDDIREKIAIADVVVGGGLSEEDLEIAENLKLFQIPFVGVDKQNLDIFKKFPNIAICNTHGNSHAVSEHALCLLLALAKDLIKNDRDLRKGKWHGFVSKETTIELFNRNLGIIGFGSIGMEIAQKAGSFGMNIYAIKRSVKKKEKEQLEKKYHLSYLGNPEQLDYVIKKSDFIIIATPLTEKTKNLIDEEKLRLMKDRYLINIGRGEIINEEVLFNSLKNGFLAGAAIDTWYQYPDKNNYEKYPSKFPFHELDNVIMTPHNAGYSDKALEENVLSVFDNIKRIYNKEEPINQINIDEGY